MNPMRRKPNIPWPTHIQAEANIPKPTTSKIPHHPFYSLHSLQFPNFNSQQPFKPIQTYSNQIKVKNSSKHPKVINFKTHSTFQLPRLSSYAPSAFPASRSGSLPKIPSPLRASASLRENPFLPPLRPLQCKQWNSLIFGKIS